jgi:putative CocE/NonD family hydrolase
MTRAGRGIVLAAVIIACGLGSATAAHAEDRWTSYERPAKYDTVVERDVSITMRDGTIIRGDVSKPDAPGPFPTLIVQTPYNKTGLVNLALGSQNDYFVERGYAVLTVDVRGTGSSGGSWDAFGEREQADGPEVVEWARKQPWSTGKIGLFGPSYMGINQIFTAARHPKGLKAIFPIIPAGDVYRDIVFSGGQPNLSFIPMWMGLVGVGGLTPFSALSGDPADLLQGLETLASHAAGVASFDLPTLAGAVTGGEEAFDGEFWGLRSPIEAIDRVKVPAFFIGGLRDLFQRGTPLLYERLKGSEQSHLLMGPWTHVNAAGGRGLPKDGVPTPTEIALRWYDHFLLGKNTHPERMPDVTQYVYGRDEYKTQPDWPDPRMKTRRMYLRGGQGLSPQPPQEPEAGQRFIQLPVVGTCTPSTGQWTAGLLDPIPCQDDNRFNENFEAVYSTPPLKKPLELSGPILANIWLTTTARDAVVTARVTDVAPGGRSKELTMGWLAGSFREVDRTRSRYVRGKLIQPWHPFTQGSSKFLELGEPTRLPIEIYPTRATIMPGHRLRLSVGPGDFPHQLPPLPMGVNSLAGQIKVLTDPKHQSFLELPGIGKCKGRCKPARVPELVRPLAR